MGITAKRNSVLIVDDSTSNIIALMNILGSEYTLYASKDGPDALETAKEHLPDVILLDIMMPEMDGYEVLSQLRNIDATKEIPIIFITGLDKSGDEEKGLASGADDYITKPFSPEVVKLRVRHQIKLIERLKQQALMAEITRNFLSDAPVDTLFTETLRLAGEFMDTAQVLLYQFEDDETTLICRNEWMNPVYNLETRLGGTIALENPMLSFIKGLTLHNKTDVCFHSNEPSFKEAMQPYRKNFSNFISVPVFIKRKICAVLDFSRKNDGRKWNESEIDLAVLVSSVFSGVFEREAMERQFSIIENSANLVLYITEDALVEYVNPAVYAVTGYTKNELTAKGLGVIFNEKTLTDIQKKYIPDALRGGAVSFEAGITRKDGEKRVLMISIVQTKKNNFGMITNDLTEIRALESGLIAAKEQAEQSSRAKSEFLSRMSHEMRTPMNAIIGMTQTAGMFDMPDGLKESFKAMDEASRQLLSLIEDVLDVSDMEYGVFKLADSVFKFNAMLRDVLQMVNYYMTEKEHSFTFDISPDIPASLMGDEKRLKQIIANLLANAIKFTPENGKISMSAHITDKKDETVILQITVTDNGIGIPEEKQKCLFDMFEQEDGSLTRKHGGIGLGLAISKRIIEMMDGGIFVKSEPGKGSAFTFTCKLRKGPVEDKKENGLSDFSFSPAPVKKEAPEQVNTAESCEGEFSKNLILIVDDMATNRFVLKNHLRNTGVKTIEAKNGKEAVDLFLAEPEIIDLIFMDIRMPEMDGYEATRRIRASELPEAGTVPIIALTAHTSKEDAEAAFASGMDYHLGKPVDSQTLIATLRRFLNNNG